MVHKTALFPSTEDSDLLMENYTETYRLVHAVKKEPGINTGLSKQNVLV